MVVAERSDESVIIPDDLLKLATASELDAYEASLKAELALSGPLEYMLYASPGFAKAYRHIVLLDEWLVALIDGRLYQNGPGPAPVPDENGDLKHPVTGASPVYHLSISMPPRFGKSFLVSEHLPAWFLTKFPELRMILASYEADFAASWGLKARRHVEEHVKVFGIEVDQETRSGARWNLKGHRGGLKTAGAGGPITGSGAHLFVIDDAIKNHEEALSALDRQSKDDWYQSTAFTRLEPWEDGTPGRMVLMNTRWHEDDLNGRVIGREPHKWAVLNLPALAEPTEGNPDPLGREVGESLCPERFTTKALIDIRDTMQGGAYWWAALYQGRPNIEGGGLLPKPYRYHRLVSPPEGGEGTYEATDFQGQVTYIPEIKCFRFATMDVAGSVKTSADWTVYSVWDISPSGLMLLRGRHRIRMETPDHESQTREWHALYPRTKFVGVENKTFGTQLIKNLVRHGGIIVRPLEADNDKVARAIPYGSLLKTGRVSFPADADWLHEWEHEHLQFPNGTNDDQVDTGAYAAGILELMPSKAPKQKEPVTTEEKLDDYIKRRFQKAKSTRRRHPTLGRY